MNPRERLCELMRKGLGGRNLHGAWSDFNRRLVAENLPQVSWDGFLQWYKGLAFPMTERRQQILGDVVGRECGDEIRRLQPPPFRAYARGIMMTTSRRKQRDFQIVPFRDESGRTVQKALIACCMCAATAYHLRRGDLDTDRYFEKEGWLVGGGPAADKCPQCRKVVHMKEHQKKPDAAPTPAPRQKTGTHKLLIGMKIGDSFDEDTARYRSGWSDTKIAAELELPVDWVKAEREHLYPGSNGDNPDTAVFVQELTILNDTHSAYEKRAAALAASVHTAEGLFKTLQEMQASIRAENVKLAADRDKFKSGLQKLLDLAETFPSPFEHRRA